MNGNPDVGPSPAYYGLGAAVILAGVGLFVYFLLTGIFHITDNLTQIVVPGEAELTLQAHLNYTIFFEEQSVVNGQIFSIRETLSGLTCHVREQSAGTEVPLYPSHTSMNYNVNGRSGRSVLEFTPQASGAYRLTCDYEQGKQGPQAVLAIGAGFGRKLTTMLSKCFAAMFGGGILGAAIIIVVYRQRENAKKQLAQAEQPFLPQR